MADLFWTLFGIAMWSVLCALYLFTFYLWACHILRLENSPSPAVVVNVALHRWRGRPSAHCRIRSSFDDDSIRPWYRADCGMTGRRDVIEQTHPRP